MGSTDPERPPVRTILHVDMDAFYVAVELLRRPELRGRPVVVGGAGRRGVVAAASYEARAHGVFSAMSSVRAQQLCPDAVFLPGDHQTYAAVSARVMAIFRSVTPLVEPLSLDEAFLDVTGARRSLGPGRVVAEHLRERVRREEGLECSVGVAPSKFLAKLASGAAKPTASPSGPIPGPGVLEVAPGHELEFLHPLPVSKVWGVGPVTLEKLRRLGVSTVGDLARLPVTTLVASLGRASGTHLHQLANGIDPRPVEPDVAPKSISHEETYRHDLVDRRRIDQELVRQGDAVAARLRARELRGRTVTVKVRFADFRTITRSITLPAPVDTAPDITRAAKELVAALDLTPGVRLLGVGVTGLVDGTVEQLTLDSLAESPAPSWSDASAAVDQIRQRFGESAIGPATAVSPSGLRVVRRGAQQWGPDDAPDGTP